MLKTFLLYFFSLQWVWFLLKPFYNLFRLVNDRKVVADRKNLVKKLLGSEEVLIVKRGPFKGLKFYNNISVFGFQLFSKIIGSYESEIFSWIDLIKNNSYTKVINVGSGDGYYAVGFAQIFPNAKVYAIDTDSDKRNISSSIIKLNGVENIELLSKYSSSLVSKNHHQLLFFDCEGCEQQLIADTDLLKKCDLIIETHNHIVPGISEKLYSAFKNSHNISSVASRDGIIKRNSKFEEIQNLTLENQSLVLSEGRHCSSEWLFLQSKL